MHTERDRKQPPKPVVDVNGDRTEGPVESKKNPHAVALGRLGGKKGGAARANSLSAQRRHEIARAAAIARWKAHDS